MQFFDTLPATTRHRENPIDWEAAKAELRANPGSWGLMVENISNSTPAQLRAGKNKHFRDDDLKHFEFSVRRPKPTPEHYGPRSSDLYGRYSEEEL